jgi:hypothetical protein
LTEEGDGSVCLWYGFDERLFDQDPTKNISVVKKYSKSPSLLDLLGTLGEGAMA